MVVRYDFRTAGDEHGASVTRLVTEAVSGSKLPEGVEGPETSV